MGFGDDDGDEVEATEEGRGADQTSLTEESLLVELIEPIEEDLVLVDSDKLARIECIRGEEVLDGGFTLGTPAFDDDDNDDVDVVVVVVDGEDEGLD